MTKFIDGPAKGQTLMLKRAPKFLRVCLSVGTFDALDQLEDSPKANEKLVAYMIKEYRGTCHVLIRPRGSGFYTMADYVVVPVQPEDSKMRTLEAWRAWCIENKSLVQNL